MDFVQTVLRPYLDLQRGDAMPLHAEGLYLHASGQLGAVADALALLGMWMPLNYRANLLSALGVDPQKHDQLSKPRDWITLAKLSCYSELRNATRRSESDLGRYLFGKASQMLGLCDRAVPERPLSRCSTVLRHVVVSSRIAEHIAAQRWADAEQETAAERRRIDAASRRLPSWLATLLELRVVSLAGSLALRRDRRKEALHIWKDCIVRSLGVTTDSVEAKWALREFCRRRAEHFVRNSALGCLNAQEIANTACEIDPYDGRAWLLNANVQANISIDLAIEYYRKAAQLDPALEGVARTKIAVAQTLSGRNRLAVIESRRALDRDPKGVAPAIALSTAAVDAPSAFSSWANEPSSDRERWVIHAFRPYFDLGPRRTGPLLTHAPLLAFEKWRSRTPHVPMMQRTPPPAFRQTLYEQAGLASSPAATSVLPLPCDSANWNLLTDAIRTFRRHELEEQLLICQVLAGLAMYEAIVILLNRFSTCKPRSSSIEAELCYTFAFAEYMLFLGNANGYRPHRFEAIASHAPKESRAVFASYLKLLVYAGKQGVDRRALQGYRRSARLALDDIQKQLDPFAAEIWESRYWRAASFEPYLLEEYSECFRQLESAKRHGECAVPKCERERIVRLENFIPILESTGRVALKVQDLDLAYQLANKRVQIDPNDALGYVDLGNSLFRLERFELAASEYMTAAALGPPGTEISWYLAGECFERIGDASAAVDMHLTSLRVDAGGASPKEAIFRLANSSSFASKIVGLMN